MNTYNQEILSKKIDEIAEFDFKNHKIFGSAYYVYNNGQTLQKCYGTMGMKGSAPITDTSIFRLASMTKPVTAVAALILVDKGLLSLNDSVDKYLPAFKDVLIKDVEGNISKPKNIPTVKDILTHSSGIGCELPKWTKITQEDVNTIDATIAFGIEIGLDYEPNSKQLYSAFVAFDVLTKIIEMVSGMDYLTFLTKELFEPCGMCDTTFILSDEQKTRLVEMHNRVDDGDAVYEMPEGCIFENFPCTHFVGGAGLASTLRDYAKFAQMLLNKGQGEKGRVLKEETWAMLASPQLPESIMPGHTRWGLGVRVIADDTYPYFPKGAFGWSGAYGSHFWVNPADNFFAVFMKNSRYDGGAENESAVNFERAVWESREEK